MAKDKLNATAKLYLAGYNLAQFAGWLYCFYKFMTFVTSKGNYEGVWNDVWFSLTIFQTLQMIEVLHCLVGLVPSSAFQTFIQIISRLIVVWGILHPVPETRISYGVPLILLAWPLAETTRYLYYALNIYNVVPYLLTWARYSLFIILYPTGVLGELLIMGKSFNYIKERLLWSITLPNFANVSFYYHIALILVMLSYIPFFPQLYFYMIRQRKKILGKTPTTNEAKSK